MKLPVIKAFSAGIALFFSKLAEFFRTLWLPALVMMIAMIYIMPRYLELSTSVAGIDPQSNPEEVVAMMRPMFKYMGLLYLAMAIIYPMMAAGVLKYVIRGHKPALPLYFQFGADELKILFSVVLLFVMLTVSYLVGTLAVLALSTATMALAPKLAMIVVPLAFSAFAVAITWFLIRVSLTLPATIGIRKVGIAESWRLTRGTAWRLFSYWFLWLLVFIVVACIYFSIGAASYFAAFMEIIAAVEPGGDAAQEAQTRLLEIQKDMWNPTSPGFWPFAIATYFYTIVYSALWNIAGGVAYRYLSGGQQT